ncbi:arginyltransferase [Parashewanella spongiae]|uniref:Aspartate/glutamate leucyltransferase n=1 Tax=Parashewanella spongiae TaxID=342950 RepID=A0A3A6U9R3_9GAMM|nr:arginyltransferase [Parashewanella spongiae]MCL1077228.1 arginyltransferase [Parashewanella spongiae]RJY18693.1 arginyltransferase [Parashewanella spongiae]
MTEETDENESIYFGLTKPFPCSYLDNQQEQLLTLTEYPLDYLIYERLLTLGFRRNGNAIYKPHCQFCSQCRPIRLPVQRFCHSKRQKRTVKKNINFIWKCSSTAKDEYFYLYERYINERHDDGPMFPATKEQYQHFLFCDWLQPQFIELYDEDILIGVAVSDVLNNSISAVYSFFSTSYDKHSLGSYLILLQIELAKKLNKDYLYLGFQVDGNRKMSYKKNYRPFQILTENGWKPE